MKMLIKWWQEEVEQWKKCSRENEEWQKKEDEAWDKWRALSEHLKWKPSKSVQHSDRDVRFWPFGDGGGMP